MCDISEAETMRNKKRKCPGGYYYTKNPACKNGLVKIGQAQEGL